MSGLSESKKLIEKTARELTKEAGLLLVDLQVKDGGANRSVLRLFVDKEGGVTLPECSSLSRSLGAVLDEDEELDHAYVLEVSSPGAERPFVHQIQYSWNIGNKLHVELSERISNKKIFEGKLSSVQEDSITLNYGKGKGKTLELPFDKIKIAYRMIAFSKNS